MDGATSECTQVTVEVARPGRRPVTKSITIVESYKESSVNLSAILDIVEDLAQEAVTGAYNNGRTVQL